MNFSLWQSITLTFCLIATHAFHSFAGPPEINGFLVSVEGETVTLRSKDGKMPQEVIVPRLFNGVRRLRIIEGEQTILGNVQPEIQTWKLGWPKSSIDWSKAKIELELDGIPQWESATSPAEADGSFRLKGSQALTHGSKLRYEPQPHKNTVGYWADASDHAWWTLELTQGSKFNVAALQGCGAGQGGSEVEVTFIREPVTAESKPVVSVQFTVEDTGHFQNFQWRHLGQITLSDKGTYRVEIRCKHKAKGAVGDFREIQLVKLPG